MFSRANQHIEVLKRIASVEESLHGMFDSGLMASLAHPDSDKAHEILDVVREVFHSENPDRTYSGDYLTHLDNVIEVAEKLDHGPTLARLLGIKRYLQKNSLALQGALSAVKQEEDWDDLRQNYYLN